MTELLLLKYITSSEITVHEYIRSPIFHLVSVLVSFKGFTFSKTIYIHYIRCKVPCTAICDC